MDHYIGIGPFLIPVVAIIGGFVLASLGVYAGIRRREFEHRERLAMIEKGIAPAAAQAKAEAEGVLPTHAEAWPSVENRGARARRAGVIVMAVGIGAAYMIWMTSHQTDDAMGIGGFLVILGAAIFLTSFFGRRAGLDAGSSRR